MAVQTGYDKLTVGNITNAVWTEHNDSWSQMKKAVDAKDDDFVIESHVTIHANEIHIGLGQATWKEAEANNEADNRAVQVAQDHVLPETVVEKYKIRAQQTKIIQRILIEIHKKKKHKQCRL